ncbi:hypothetical protein GCM10028813_30260 [Ramlibacter alkalitolerans]
MGALPTWYWRYKPNGKTKYERLGTTTELTLDQARKRVMLLKAQEAIAPRSASMPSETPACMTLNDFWDLHVLPRFKSKKRSWSRDVQLYKRIRPRFGNKPLTEIRRLEVDQFLRDLVDAGLSFATANHHGQLLRRILNLAVTGEVIPKNVLQRLELFHLANGREVFLNEEQVARFTEAVGNAENRRVALILLFLLSTGARLREALDAEWGQFDRDKNIWRVPATNAKANRVIQRHLGPSALWVLDEIGTEGVSKYVFPSPATGKPYTTITRAWYCLRRKAGLPDNVRIHDLRHTAASRVACETGSLVAVKHQLGHADVRMANRYAHLTDKTVQVSGDTRN